jgi:hypothetical protein
MLPQGIVPALERWFAPAKAERIAPQPSASAE